MGYLIWKARLILHLTYLRHSLQVAMGTDSRQVLVRVQCGHRAVPGARLTHLPFKAVHGLTVIHLPET